MNTKNLYIFRHGETDWNTVFKLQGQSKDMPLNQKGLDQAHALAENMQNINLQAIYTSPLRRAY